MYIKAKDFVGQKFNSLVVIAYSGEKSPNGKRKWKCICEDCGAVSYRTRGYLKEMKFCPCALGKHMHGLSKTRTYRIWAGMIRRCHNHWCREFPYYGGRGIRVCERWRLSFLNFLADMGERPPGKSLDRINNDGNYEPSNCRWANSGQQANNTRANVNVTYNGKTQSVAKWARDLGIEYGLLLKRIRMGWPVKEAFEMPVISKGRRHPRMLHFDGQDKPLTEWARLLDIDENALRVRLSMGWSAQRALSTPVRKRKRRTREEINLASALAQVVPVRIRQRKNT